MTAEPERELHQQSAGDAERQGPTQATDAESTAGQGAHAKSLALGQKVCPRCEGRMYRTLRGWWRCGMCGLERK